MPLTAGEADGLVKRWDKRKYDASLIRDDLEHQIKNGNLRDVKELDRIRSACARYEAHEQYPQIRRIHAHTLEAVEKDEKKKPKEGPASAASDDH